MDIEISTGEPSLEDVAATLLVKPIEEKAEEGKEPTRVAEGEDEVVTEENAEPSTEEKSGDEATSNEEEADTEGENEEDVDIDELDIDVVVDGEEKKVKLKELKANYSGEKVIEKRLQEATEAKTYAIHNGQQLYIALEAEAVRLAKIDEVLQKVVEPEINWEELRRTNPARYLLERDRQREAQEKQSVVNHERTQIAQRQQALIQKATEEYTLTQARELVTKIPEFAKPTEAGPMMAKLTTAAREYGYSPEEVGAVMDHRAMLVLRDAMRYQEMVGQKKELTKKAAPSTTLLRPSASKPKSEPSTARKLQDALRRKAIASGRPEDVAATLLMRRK